jgi:hypothetical protein
MSEDPVAFIIRVERERDPLKQQYASIDLCGTTSQKTANLIRAYNLFLCPEGKIHTRK